MPKISKLPVRMCISCRGRHEQRLLLRLQYIEDSLESFSGSGRSFYICYSCLDNDKKITKSLMRQCRTGDKDNLINRLKEIITDDRKS